MKTAKSASTQHTLAVIASGDKAAAIRALALRAALGPTVKRAGFDPGQAMETIREFAAKHPNALWGAGIGGALGLGHSMISSDKKRGPVTSTLLGGALGGGAGALGDTLNDNAQQQYEKELMKQVPQGMMLKKADPLGDMWNTGKSMASGAGDYLNKNVVQPASNMAQEHIINPIGQAAAHYGVSDALGQAGDYVNKNPWARGALWGAGIGGGLGLASSLMSGKKKKTPISDALTGALMGGGIGGLGMHYLGQPSPEAPVPGRTNQTPEQIGAHVQGLKDIWNKNHGASLPEISAADPELAQRMAGMSNAERAKALQEQVTAGPTREELGAGAAPADATAETALSNAGKTVSDYAHSGQLAAQNTLDHPGDVASRALLHQGDPGLRGMTQGLGARAAIGAGRVGAGMAGDAVARMKNLPTSGEWDAYKRLPEGDVMKSLQQSMGKVPQEAEQSALAGVLKGDAGLKRRMLSGAGAAPQSLLGRLGRFGSWAAPALGGYMYGAHKGQGPLDAVTGHENQYFGQPALDALPNMPRLGSPSSAPPPNMPMGM